MGWWSWCDPSKGIRTPEQSMINPIYSQVGLGDKTEELLPNATFPTLEDLKYAEEDYIIGPTDFLRISVLDLLQTGVETIMERQVSHSGQVDLLLVGSIKADGLTKDQLVEDIKDVYRRDFLKDPNVSIMVVAPRQNIFSIMGAISRPGTYGIMRKDFTLMEALALSGDVGQVNIDWLYIYRPSKDARKVKTAAPVEKEELPPLPTIPDVEPAPRPATAPAPKPATTPATDTAPSTKKAAGTQEQLDDLVKVITSTGTEPIRSEAPAAVKPSVAGSSAPRTSVETPSRPPAALDKPEMSRKETGARDIKAAAVTYKWAYSNGRWIRVPQSTTQTTSIPLPRREGAGDKDRYGWSKWNMSHLSRIIAIDLKELKAGNPRMNVIIRDDDIVYIPPLKMGEFYMMGEVLRPGAYSLTGRRITVKMALASAGNLGPLAWPNNSILIRRIGRDQEQIIPLRLQNILQGRERDIFLKPNDIIAVGSYWAAPFLAVWRNAFRLTYGFGFIYDRNYSEMEFEVPLLAPKSDARKSW